MPLPDRLPKLIIDSGVLPNPQEWEKIKIWLNSRSDPSASGYRRGQEYLLRLPRLAYYSFKLASETVTAYPFDSVSLKEVRKFYYRFVLPVFFQAIGMQKIHASAVLTDNGVVLLCGESFTGKSTIAYALSRRGYKVWADDAVVFDHTESGIRTFRIHNQIKLRKESAKYFHVQNRSSEYPEEAPICLQPIHSIFLLRRAEACVRAKPLKPVEALPRLLQHAHIFQCNTPAQRLRIFNVYIELSLRPVYDLRFPAGLEHLNKILEEIENKLAIRV